MKHVVTSREVVVDIEDALPVTVTTPSLTKRIIVPIRMTLSTSRDGSHTVTLLGPQVREDGQMTATYFKGKVSIDPENDWHVNAPKWVHALATEVER